MVFKLPKCSLDSGPSPFWLDWLGDIRLTFHRSKTSWNGVRFAPGLEINRPEDDLSLRAITYGAPRAERMNKKIYIMNILRPLSPHLPFYKPQLTSTFPISHRISGAFLATIVLFFYLLFLKIGLICFTYDNFYKFFFYSSKLILISVEITALALSYHLFNGVRHLLTDFSGFIFLRIGRKRLKWLKIKISPIPLPFFLNKFLFLWNALQ